MPGIEEIPISFDDIQKSRNAPEIDACVPIFHTLIVEDLAKGEETGKREYKEVIFVKVLSPGNDKEIPDFEVKDEHRKRWPAQWKAFSENKEVEFEGYPLKNWQGITPVETRMLKDASVFSVEVLSELPDSNLTNIGQGFLLLKHRAKAFLESQKGEAGFMKLQTENEEQTSQLETQAEQIRLLEEKVSELMSTSIGKKGSSKGK
jgi:hypothetical protein